MKIVSAFLSIFVTVPIWLYLQYKILVLVNASELMWFLYYAYVPTLILTLFIAKLAEVQE